jgi:hypothetical protein
MCVNISIEMAESPTAQNVKVCGKGVGGERDIRGLQVMKWKKCAVRIRIKGVRVSGGPGGGVPPYERYGGSGSLRRRVGSLKWGGFVGLFYRGGAGGIQMPCLMSLVRI